MARFISDEEMAKLEASSPTEPKKKKFISDEEMALLEGKTNEPNLVGPPTIYENLKNLKLSDADDFIDSVKEGSPFSGLAKKGAAATVAGSYELGDMLGITKKDRPFSERYNEIIERDAEDKKERDERIPSLSTLGEVGGSFLMPGVGAGGKGIGAMAKVGGINAGINAVDQGVKENSLKDAIDRGGKSALISAGISAIPIVGKAAKEVGKLTGKAFTGIPMDVAEHYLKNSDKVDAAKPLKEISDEFLKKTDDISSDLGRQSSESFQALRESGLAANKNTFTDPFLAEIDRLNELGVYGPERERAINIMNKFMKNINKEAGDLGLDKGKALINQLDSTIGGLMKKPDADTQVVNSFLDIRKQIDNMLKESVPEYAEQMAKLADETKTVRELSDRFRTPKGAQDLLKRTQTGKDGYADDALAAFDKKFGTKYQEELRDSFVKDAFTKDATRGSRNVNVGAIAGSAGGIPGAIAGAAVGHVADKFGGPIYQKLLKAGVKAGPYMQVLENAAQKGNFPIVHYLMMKNDPEYRDMLSN